MSSEHETRMAALEKRLLSTSDPEKRAELRRQLERLARERETR